MIKRHYPPDSKRSLNIIWNAAGNYDFDPPFLAFHSNGQPDLYFDMVIGLAEKWLDMDMLTAFFDSFSYSRDYAEYDEFIWLAIESAVYAKELPERPALKFLRLSHAEEFFKVQQTLSKQQMELMSMPVYTQLEARWASVSNRRLPVMTAKQKAMYEALALDGTVDTEELILKMQSFLGTFFGFTFNENDYRKKSPRGLWLKKLWGRKQGQLKNQDKLIVRTGTGTGDAKNAVHLNQESGFRQDNKDAEAVKAYIEGCFGPSIFSDGELKDIENDLCRGNDLGLKLWFSRAASDKDKNISAAKAPVDGSSGTGNAGSGHTGTNTNTDTNTDAFIGSSSGIGTDTSKRSVDPGISKEVRIVRTSAAAQRDRNLEYLKTHSLQVRENIKKLSAEIEVLISTFLKHLPEKAVSGRLYTPAAYRLPLFNDSRIFLREGDEAENCLMADILLDASQSRMNSQELISSEAYIIAESMEKAGIPVRVLSFRSLRGYTVLEELKSYKDKRSTGVTGYYAAGWNRDALAIKAAGHLIKEDLKKDAVKQHMLLILTDASPNDSTPLAPEAGKTRGRNYEGLAPVEDARRAVNALRADGIYTAAIFHGASSHLENLYQIYGKEYVRIRSLAQLAPGVISLLQMLLTETEAK